VSPTTVFDSFRDRVGRPRRLNGEALVTQSNRRAT